MTPSIFRAHLLLSLRTMLFLLTTILLAFTGAVTTIDDGHIHTIHVSMEDSITVRSSSTLTLPLGDYKIHAPAGCESTIRLYMSSSLNATGGDIIGCDASSDDTAGESAEKVVVVTTLEAGAGIIVGSASRAEFYAGTTVRGGNHLGGGSVMTSEVQHFNLLTFSSSSSSSSLSSLSSTTKNNNNMSVEKIGGTGGDAIIGQYFGSTITIHGGNFIGGKGSASNGHSLHLGYDARANIHGGDFHGSWLVHDQAVITVHGCSLARVGNRLVGTLEDGTPLDVQLVEQNGGVVSVNQLEGDDKCNNDSSGYKNSSAATLLLGGTVWMAMVIAISVVVF